VRFSESSDSEKSAEGVAGHDERGLILEGSILAYRPALPFKKLQRQPGDVMLGGSGNNDVRRLHDDGLWCNIQAQLSISKRPLRWRREQVALAARDNIITAIAA
jgi:hypothetical protein